MKSLLFLCFIGFSAALPGGYDCPYGNCVSTTSSDPAVLPTSVVCSNYDSYGNCVDPSCDDEEPEETCSDEEETTCSEEDYEEEEDCSEETPECEDDPVDSTTTLITPTTTSTQDTSAPSIAPYNNLNPQYNSNPQSSAASTTLTGSVCLFVVSHIVAFYF